MKAIKSALVATVLAAGTLVVAGCDPATTGSSGASGSGGITCDPNGFGPLSGCDSTGDSAQKPAETTPKPAETTSKPAETTPEPTRIDATPCEADLNGNGCVTGSRPKFEYKVQGGNKETIQSSDNGFTVTVTWIVVSIDFTGFRECVIGLREAPANPDDHFSHRLTTAKDCQAQRVDAVYRPVGD